MTAAYRPMSLGTWALLVTVAAMWGGSFFFLAFAVRDLPAFTIVLGRVALGGTMLWVLVRLSGHAMPHDRRAWIAFLVMGVLNNALPFSLTAWAQHHIASSLAAILNASMPLWTILVAHIFTRDERLTGPGIDISKRGPLRCARLIAGSVYAVGADRQVYQQTTERSWRRLDDEQSAPPPDTATSFESVDGYSADEIYAVGLRGEIWQRSHGWQQVFSPANRPLSAVCCAGDGRVYAAFRCCGGSVSGSGRQPVSAFSEKHGFFALSAIRRGLGHPCG